jgi:hypothetical protein
MHPRHARRPSLAKNEISVILLNMNEELSVSVSTYCSTTESVSFFFDNQHLLFSRHHHENHTNTAAVDELGISAEEIDSAIERTCYQDEEKEKYYKSSVRSARIIMGVPLAVLAVVAVAEADTPAFSATMGTAGIVAAGYTEGFIVRKLRKDFTKEHEGLQQKVTALQKLRAYVVKSAVNSEQKS